MASESCSTSSSSSGDDFVPIFYASQSYEVIPQNLRQEAEYNTVDETDAAAAAAEGQFDENESDPDLDLCPPASRAGKTFWCQCGECVVQGSKTGTRLLFWLCRVCGESSLSVEGLHVDLQLSRSTCQCFQASSFSYVLLDGVDRPFGHDQAPSKMSHPATVSGKLLFFSTCASFLRRWIVQSPLFVSFLHTFSVEVAEQPPNNVPDKFLVPRKPMKAHAILSVLVDLAAAESATEDRFQRRRPTRLTLSCTMSARSSSLWKALELSEQ